LKLCARWWPPDLITKPATSFLAPDGEGMLCIAARHAPQVRIIEACTLWQLGLIAVPLPDTVAAAAPFGDAPIPARTLSEKLLAKGPLAVVELKNDH
jgi:hypothetical protein